MNNLSGKEKSTIFTNNMNRLLSIPYLFFLKKKKKEKQQSIENKVVDVDVVDKEN